MRRSIYACLFFAVTFAVPAFAHHGRDFLIVETAEIPEPREFFFFSSHDLFVRHGDHTIEIEPALLGGISERFALEIHSHIARESGDDFRYKATAPALRVVLTPPESSSSWRAALSAEYEIAHGEEANRAEARLILTRAVGDANLVLNLIGERQAGDNKAGYAIGFRPSLTSRLSWGLEGEGRFEQHSTHEILFGIYGQPSERITLKMGLGAGVGQGSPVYTIRTAFVVHLR